MRVADLEIHRFVAGQAGGGIGGVEADLEPLGTPQGQRQADDLVLGVPGEVQRWRGQVDVGDVEGRAIGQDAARLEDGELAGHQGRLVDHQMGETPVIADQGCHAGLHPPGGVAVLLLKMLGLQKEAFRPDNPTEPRHCDDLLGRSRSALGADADRIPPDFRLQGIERVPLDGGYCPPDCAVGIAIGHEHTD